MVVGFGEIEHQTVVRAEIGNHNPLGMTVRFYPPDPSDNWEHSTVIKPNWGVTRRD